MKLTGSLSSLNKAAVALVKAGDHQAALALFNQLFDKLSAQHLTHPELFTVYSNRAACHLALQQYKEAVQDAQQCLVLIMATAAHAGLQSASRHPHWPKACQRLGDALTGTAQYKQAAAVYEAGLSVDPLNPNLRASLQHAQQGLIQDLLAGKALNHMALPAPPTPQRITLAPHNTSRAALQGFNNGVKPLHMRQGSAGQRKYAVGWQLPPEGIVRAAEAGEVVSGEDAGLAVAGGCSSSWQLPQLLLTPATAMADPALSDVYEYVQTQCHLAASKRYMYRQLTDSPRMAAWWAATAAAVQAVQASGRAVHVLLLGAKAGVLAVAAARAGAAHITCVETCPHLAAACKQVLLDNGLPAESFSVTTTHPTSLQLGRDLQCVCNCLIADIIDDGVLSGGFIPAVAHALDELMVRDDPVIVPAAVTVMGQAVAVRPSAWQVLGLDGSSGCELHDEKASWIDLSALDQHRWTPSQSLPSPLDPPALLPLSAPVRVWHLPSMGLDGDLSAVAVIDVELTATGGWAGVAVWAELQLFADITFSTAGPWQQYALQQKPALNSSSNSSSSSSSSSSSAVQPPPSHQPAICWLEGPVPVSAGEVYPLVACHNTVRMSFTLKEADYQYLFAKQPSFPHSQFAMAADHSRIAAYSAAMKAAIARLAAAKQQQQQQEGLAAVEGAADGGAAAGVDVHVLDVGCGSGVLSMLAVSAAADVFVPAASATLTTADAGGNGTAAVAVAVAAAAAAGDTHSLSHHTGPSIPIKASVVGVELVAPVAAAAVQNVARNGCSSAVSIVAGDAAMLERGAQVPHAGVDVVVFDLFDAGLIGHQVLAQLEIIKCKLLADGAQVVPAVATLYMVGLEVTTTSTWQVPAHAAGQQLQSEAIQGGNDSSDDVAVDPTGAGAVRFGAGARESANAAAAGMQEVSVDLSALEQFKWSDTLETVLLDHVPHVPLTRPVKVFDFDFCAPAGTPYPTEASLQSEVIAAGRLNAVGLWFDLHLAEGVSITSAPAAFTTGGRIKDEPSKSKASRNTGCNSSSSSTSASSSSSGSIQASVHTEYLHAQADVTGSTLQQADSLLKMQQCADAEPFNAAEDLGAAGPAVRASTAADEVPGEGPDATEAVTCTAIIIHPSAADKHEEQLQQREMQPQQDHEHHHWGQALCYLEHTAVVSPGDAVRLLVERQGPQLTVKFLGGSRTAPAAATPTAAAAAAAVGQNGSSSAKPIRAGCSGADQDAITIDTTLSKISTCCHHSSSSTSSSSSLVPLLLEPAVRPPWLKAGAGIEDPNVWAVKKCQQLLGQMLQRAPGGRFPPIWQDLELMQVHAGSLGLDAAVVGAISQEMSMREALAVAAQKQLAVSAAASAEAAGVQPPVVWR